MYSSEVEDQESFFNKKRLLDLIQELEEDNLFKLNHIQEKELTLEDTKRSFREEFEAKQKEIDKVKAKTLEDQQNL